MLHLWSSVFTSEFLSKKNPIFHIKLKEMCIIIKNQLSPTFTQKYDGCAKVQWYMYVHSSMLTE